MVLYVNVHHYGARGDGQHDDTAGIAAALAVLPPGGGIICFPPGEYVTAPIQLPTTAPYPAQAGIHLRGAGCTVSILRPRDPHTSCIVGQPLITTNLGTAPNRISQLGFRPHAAGSLHGVDLRSMSFARIQDVAFFDNGSGRFQTGLFLSTIADGGIPGSAHCYNNVIDGVYINKQPLGPLTLIRGVGTPNVTRIDNVVVNGETPMQGIDVDSTAIHWIITNCHFEVMQGTCVRPSNFFTMRDCYMELCLRGLDGTGRESNDVSVERCCFNYTPNAAVASYQFTRCYTLGGGS